MEDSEDGVFMTCFFVGEVALDIRIFTSNKHIISNK